MGGKGQSEGEVGEQKLTSGWINVLNCECGYTLTVEC